MNETVNVAVDAPLSPRRKALRIILAVFALAAVAGGMWWWLVASKHETTTDAYVAGDQVTVSALVPGTVVKLGTEDTAAVHAGDVLVELDPSDSDVSLARAAAMLTQSVRQTHQQLATAAQFDADVQQRRLELAQAEQRLERRLPLLANQAVAAEDVTQAETAVALARAALTSSQQQAAAAHALTGTTALARQPAVLEARAAYQQAWLNAHRNRVLAPVGGQVARRNVQLGQRVPVRIQLDAAEVAAHPLRVGMSTYVAVDTREQDARTLQARAPVAPATSTSLYDDGRTAAAAAADAVIAGQVPAAP